MNILVVIALIGFGFVAGVVVSVCHFLDEKSIPDNSYEIGYAKGKEDAEKEYADTDG